MPTRTWGTLVADLLDRCSRTVASNGDQAKRAVCEACEFLDGDEAAWFRQGRYSFVLTEGKSRYAYGDGASGAHQGVPGDVDEWVEDPVLEIDGDANNAFPLPWTTVSYAETDGPYTGYDDATTAAPREGQPKTIAWWSGELIVKPVPAKSGDVVAGRYHRRLGHPYYDYSGSAWNFYKPNGEAMVDGWPDRSKGEANGWFEDGYPVLLYRALAVFYAVYLKSEEDGGEAMTKYLEEVEKLRVRTDHRSANAGFIRPYLPGGSSGPGLYGRV